MLQEQHFFGTEIKKNNWPSIFPKETHLYTVQIFLTYDSFIFHLSSWSISVEIIYWFKKEKFKRCRINNGNVLPSIPVAHSVIFKELYENLDFLLSKIKYPNFKWQICGDFKIASMLLGQQGCYAKMPWFLCEWDSWAKYQHWIRKEWLTKKQFKSKIKSWSKRRSKDKIRL